MHEWWNVLHWWRRSAQVQVSVVVGATHTSGSSILHQSYQEMLDMTDICGTQGVVFPSRNILFIMLFCRCPSGYVGSYCEMGKSKGAPAGTGTVTQVCICLSSWHSIILSLNLKSCQNRLFQPKPVGVLHTCTGWHVGAAAQWLMTFTGADQGQMWWFHRKLLRQHKQSASAFADYVEWPKSYICLINSQITVQLITVQHLSWFRKQMGPPKNMNSKLCKVWWPSSCFYFIFFIFFIYLTRKCLIEIKNLLYKSVLAKTAAAARHTKFIQYNIKHKTVTDNI